MTERFNQYAEDIALADGIFLSAEKMFLDIVKKQKKKGEPMDLVTSLQNGEAIRFLWQENALHRAIMVKMLGERSVKVHAAAWETYKFSDGTGVRFSHREQFGDQLSPESAELATALQDAYSAVSSWTPKKLRDRREFKLPK
jgi:N-acetyl-beta-hexosaminidase